MDLGKIFWTILIIYVLISSYSFFIGETCRSILTPYPFCIRWDFSYLESNNEFNLIEDNASIQKFQGRGIN